VWGWVHLASRPLLGLLYQIQMIDDVCEAVYGMRISRRNWSTHRKPAPALLCAPQIPHYLTWDRTPAAAVGIRRLAAWAMMRPHTPLSQQKIKWPTFTYFGSDTITIAKLFRNTNVKIEFKTDNTIQRLLKPRERTDEVQNLSGVYQLKCDEAHSSTQDRREAHLK
jgi:hypothetical protein